MLAQANALQGADAARVQVVFVSVDPERDDLAQMRSFVTGFGRSFIGLTGSPAQVAPAC